MAIEEGGGVIGGHKKRALQRRGPVHEREVGECSTPLHISHRLAIIGSGFGSCCIGSCCIGSCCIRNFCLVRFGIGRVAPGHEQRVIAAGLPEQAC